MGLTDRRKTAKILADNRKGHHPIETLLKLSVDFCWDDGVNRKLSDNGKKAIGSCLCRSFTIAT